MKILVLIFLFSCSLPSFSQDTTFVTPSELEVNSGLYPRESINGAVLSYPNTIIGPFNISPNGKFLAYSSYTKTSDYWDNDLKDPIFHIQDLYNNREIFTVNYTDFALYSNWFLDSITILFYIISPPDSSGRSQYEIVKMNLKTLLSDTLNIDNSITNFYLSSIGADRKGYVIWTDTIPSHGKRLLIDSSFKVGRPINEPIPDYSDKGVLYGYSPLVQRFYPEFPPCDISYSLTEFQSVDSIQVQPFTSGFSIVKNFDYQNNRSDFKFSSIPIPDTSWSYIMDNYSNPWGYYEVGGFALGGNGDLYFNYGYISNREKAIGAPAFPFDSVMLAARSTLGIYRIDTSGKNLVQLVRSWWGGNIQVTCDGTIYYYMINWADTTSSIWKMNKYGKEKQMVFNLKKPVTSVSENPIKYNGNDIYPNPASDYIYLNKGASSFVEYGDIEIYSVYGTRVLSSNTPPNPLLIEGGNMKMDVSSLPQGVYFVVVGAGSKPVLRAKFIVIH